MQDVSLLYRGKWACHSVYILESQHHYNKDGGWDAKRKKKKKIKKLKIDSMWMKLPDGHHPTFQSGLKVVGVSAENTSGGIL